MTPKVHIVVSILVTDSDIICFTETHLDDTIPNGNMPIENSTVFCHDCNVYGVDL